MPCLVDMQYSQYSAFLFYALNLTKSMPFFLGMLLCQNTPKAGKDIEFHQMRNYIFHKEHHCDKLTIFDRL